MMTTLRLALVTLPLLFSGSLSAAESREWTSKDGTAKLTASFHKVEGDKVVLILPNGRTQAIARTFLSDADVAWIDQNSGAPAPGNVAATGSTTNASAKIPAALAGKLIDDRGKPFDFGEAGGPPKYYLFYYSASWCGPCQAFTPELVKFHRKMKARKADFEVILVPSDKTQEDEVAYMKEKRMPWPALALDERQAAEIPRNARGGIPSMVLADADGKRLLQVDDQLSMGEFLDQTEKIFGGKDPATAQN